MLAGLQAGVQSGVDQEISERTGVAHEAILRQALDHRRGWLVQADFELLGAAKRIGRLEQALFLDEQLGREAVALKTAQVRAGRSEQFFCLAWDACNEQPNCDSAQDGQGDQG